MPNFAALQEAFRHNQPHIK